MRRTKAELIVALIILILLMGCAGTRKRTSRESAGKKSMMDWFALAESTRDFNISEKGFIIKRAAVEITGTPTEGKVNLIARVNNRGDIYASVRGPLGIELARIIAVGDSVFVINKMQRVIMYGGRRALLKKAGLPDDAMGIFFGDIPEGMYSKDSVMNQGNLVSAVSDEGEVNREIAIDRREMKISEEEIVSANGDDVYSLRFNNFRESSGVKFPSLIELYVVKKEIRVLVNITVMEVGNRENIEVSIPKYRREAL